MRDIPHPIIFKQISAPQPKLWIVGLCLVAASWLPTVFSYVLMRWPFFSHFVAPHDLAYRITFFCVQLSLFCAGIAFLSKRHASAIWTPQPSWRHGITVSLPILLPLLLFHLSTCILGIHAMLVLSGFGVEDTKMLASLYNEVWGRQAYGPSLAGVLSSSVLLFASPILEEIVFTGFTLNAIAKRYGSVAAVLGVPVCFALVHAFQFGLGTQLIPLFFAGLTYALIRLSSGSLLLAILGHWTINALVFLPKWVVAVMYFAQA